MKVRVKGEDWGFKGSIFWLAFSVKDEDLG